MEISHRHSVGLRRDLIRALYGKVEESPQNISYFMGVASRPIPDARTERRVSLRLAKSLQSLSIGSVNKDSRSGIFALRQEDTDTISLAHWQLPHHRFGSVWGFRLLWLFDVTFHALERAFQRLESNDVQAVIKELALLGKNSVLPKLWLTRRATKRPIRALPFEGEDGIWLAVPSETSRKLMVKTFVAKGTNSTYDKSIESIQQNCQWNAEHKRALVAEDPIAVREFEAKFERLLKLPCNEWWFTYQG